MRSCLGIGLLLSAWIASAAAAAEPEPQGATLGPPVVREPAVRQVQAGDAAKLPPAITAGQPAPVVEKKPVLDPTGLKFETPAPFAGRVSVRGDAGDGVGYKRGFAYLEGMLPIRQSNGSLFFSDLRIVNFDRENRWEGNVGLGYRWFSEPVNRVLGVNSFFDARSTGNHTYQQIGLGMEVLSPSFEFRLNGYFIAGPAHYLVGDPVFVPLGVINGNIVTQRYQPVQVARGGLDLELGGRLPILDQYAPRAYLGFYTYSAAGAQTANGIRGRFESQLTQQISGHLSLQHDRVFQTTLTGGVAFHFGAPAYRTGNVGRATWEDVLRQRINRDVNIVISQEQATTRFSNPLPPPPPPPSEPSEGEQGPPR